ncbi:MAG: 5-methyltetrahydropteroyltriglutamate--homocysteine methyltransferase [Acetobacteraceae bacterium]|nr:5-methyltetrahydropteroyltriglutamate--homocysteine methyltransferase [Acetobacteraceae bacterium]
MRRSTERILTTHAGSLPRPENLTGLFVRRAQGESVGADDIAAASLDALRAIVPKQAEAGVDVGNNGEQQRDSFFLYLKERLTGLGGTWQRPSRADVDRYPEFKKRYLEQTSSKGRVSPNEGLPMAIGEVRYIDAAAIEAECRNFSEVLNANPGVFSDVFMNAPSPGIVAAAIKNQHYDTDLKYLQALGEALRVEYEAIVRAGFVLQIDAPDLALERHISFKDRPLSAFVDFVENVVSVINAALKNILPDRVRLHICWGNSESPHDSDVPLEDILPTVCQAKVGALYLPFAGPRHAHEFRCFEQFPLRDDQLLIAGVIDPLTNIVEHPEVVADRIGRVAAALGDPSKVLAANDCGFDTSAGWGRVAPDVVWAKLRSLRDGARIASTRLF